MDRHFFARFISMKSACPFCRSISAVTGGKFANGATTAAIGQAFNGNSFWDKAKELGQLAITLGDGFVPGASLANCALNGGCSYMTWAFAVGEVIGALTGVGVVAWAAKAAYKAFKSGKAVDKIKEIFNRKKSTVEANQAAGDAARDAIAARTGGQTEVNFRVTGGLRRVDVLDGTTAIESKVGRTSLTKRVRQELARDVKMLRSGQVDKVQWEFTRSQVTGKIGPTGPLRQKLQKFGIEIIEN